MICTKEDITSSFLELAVNHPHKTVQHIIARDSASSPELLQKVLENSIERNIFNSICSPVAKNLVFPPKH